jgi:hypothetical protein
MSTAIIKIMKLADEYAKAYHGSKADYGPLHAHFRPDPITKRDELQQEIMNVLGPSALLPANKD